MRPKSRTIYDGRRNLPPIDFNLYEQEITDEDYTMDNERAAELARDRDTERYHSDADMRLIGQYIVPRECIDGNGNADSLEEMNNQWLEATEEYDAALMTGDIDRMRHWQLERLIAAGRLSMRVDTILTLIQEAD